LLAAANNNNIINPTKPKPTCNNTGLRKCGTNKSFTSTVGQGTNFSKSTF
jgi:hypothetical protein